jgi:hypothetical protein
MMDMNGALIPVFPKTRYDFGFLTGTNTQITVVAPAIDLIQFKSVVLLVRVHRINLTAGSLTFSLLNTLPSDEDPQEFTDSGTAILSLPISGSVGSLLNATASSPQAFGKLVLTAVQSSTGNPLYAEVSCCLLGRCN